MGASRSEERLSDAAIQLVELARGSIGEMPEWQRAAGLNALRHRLSGQHRVRSTRWGALAMGGALAGVLSAGVALHLRHGRETLSFRVEGAELEPGGSVRATGPRSWLRFSDGSEVALAQGAHARVRSIDERGARVTLDEGDAHVYVVHARETRWAFDAGPFVVAVTGTAFGLSWHESARRLDVRLENGTVTVSGPASDAPLALRAGQWLTVRGNDVTIRSLTASSDPEGVEPVDTGEAGVHGVDLRSDADGEAGTAPARSSQEHVDRLARPAAAPRTHWASDLANGRFQSILDQALARGLDATFAESSADELAALADAARYTRRADIARAALFAERRRFARSEHARVAAFLLGRMAEGSQESRSALSWFDVYLAESPTGTFASEALGRKMMLVQALEGKQAAQSLAEAYLGRFPGGTYAEAARALIAAP
jgi:TolA-binding protein